MIFNRITLILFLFFLPLILFSQNDTIKYDIELSTLASTGKYSPFWLQSNRYGKVSAQANSAYVSTSIAKDFYHSKSIFDYGFKADVLVRSDKLKNEVLIHELYAKARLLIFNLTVGAREEIYGNQDSTLSCGGFLFSKNAQPIPKITLGVDKFTYLPNTNDIQFKGGMSHGKFNDNQFVNNVLFHHKYLYMRFKTPSYPVWAQFGLEHVAQWGGNFVGVGQESTSLSDFKNVFLGRSGDNSDFEGEIVNAVGNHIVTQSLKFETKIKDYEISAYWQHIAEDGPIILMWNAMNINDGLWGLSIKNKNFPYIKGFLYEFLNTADQSGPFHDKDGIVYGGVDSYFTNYVYKSGWTYNSRTIGTPFISSPVYNTDGSIIIKNNRLKLHHFGFEGDVEGYNYKLLASFSKYYGKYSRPYIKTITPNTSILLEVNKKFPKLLNLEASVSLGTDIGNVYGNSFGCLVSIRKKGDLFNYGKKH